MASDVDIVLQVATQGVENVYKLSNAMKQLNQTVSGAVNPTRALDAQSKALNRALGIVGSTTNNHAKSLTQLRTNYGVLSDELRRVQKELNGLGREYQFSGKASSSWRNQVVSDMRAYESAIKSARLGALVSDLNSIALAQRKLGKDAQFVGRSLIIGITTPLVVGARQGLQSLVAIDSELVRLNKVLESVAPNAENAAKKMGIDLASANKQQTERIEEMVGRYKELEKALTSTSMKFGISKSLTIGLAGDFAELGVQSTKNISKMVELTAEIEKLGSMDIGPSKDLMQSLYFQAIRTITAAEQARVKMGDRRPLMGAVERETAAIKAATAQLYMFNLVENVTALTLKDLGDAFPEVAAAATSFGLSMTEAAAMLAPMKAAGFEVGASANAIKVSLQRITAPTKQNAEMFKQLTKEYGFNFNLIKGTGLDAIQSLIDAYNLLLARPAGAEGALEFFAKVFGVRQGPRMEVSIQQLATFDATLKNVNAGTDLAEKRIQRFANTAIESGNRSTKANVPLINSFRDIGIVARLSTAEVGDSVEGMTGTVTAAQIEVAKKAREAVTKEIVKAAQQGEDLVGQISGEAGRAMIVQLAGPVNAQIVAQRELENALGSLETVLGRIRNNFKMFASDLLVGLKPTIEKIEKALSKLYKSWTELSDSTRQAIANTILIVGGLVASIGPLVFAFGQARLAVGVLMGAVTAFLPALKTMSIENVVANKGLLRLKNGLTMTGDTVYNTNSKFHTFLATLANQETRVGRLADKYGRLIGALKETETAQTVVQRKAMAQQGKQLVARQSIEEAGIFGVTQADIPTRRPIEMRDVKRARRGSSAMGKKQILRAIDDIRSRNMITGGDIDLENQATLRRVTGFQRAGIRQTDSGQFAMGDRALRRGQAMRIARGKMDDAGLLTKISGKASGIDTAVIAGRAYSKSISMAKAPLNSFKNAIDSSRKAVNALKVDTGAFGSSAPGVFAKAKTAVGGFAKSFTLVKLGIAATKVALIASGIGAVILAISIGVMLIVKNFDKFKSSASGGIDAVKRAIDILKETLIMLIRPVIDLFARFSSGSQGGVGAAGALGKALSGIGKAFEKVAQVVRFVVQKVIQPMLYFIVNIVAAVVSVFQGKWGKAFDYLKTAVGFVGPIIVNVFALALKGVLIAAGALVKGLIKLFGEAGKLLLEALSSPLKKLLSGASGLPIVGNIFKGLKNSFDGLVKSAKGVVDSGVRVMGGVVDGFVNVATGAVDTVAKKVNSKFEDLKKGGIRGSRRKITLGGGRRSDTDVPVDTDPLKEETQSAVGDGMSEGADEGAKAMADRIKSLRTELIDEIMNKAKEAIKSIADSLEEALRKQKDKSLAVFDEQLETIARLKKEEESLTRKKEYEANRRALIDERNLSREAYIRNRAFAIYEGRADDALALDIQNKKDELDSKKKIEDLDARRAKELADENLQRIIDSINNAKKAASELFDEQIENFKKAAEKILEFGPTNAEEFNNQMQRLREAAQAAGVNIGTTLTSSFSGISGDLASVIGNITTDIQAPFNTAMSSITAVITSNNPFGENGVWQTIISTAMDTLTTKYQGAINAFNTILDTSSEKFEALKKLYLEYKNLTEGTPGGGGGAGSGGGGGGGGGGAGGGTGGSGGGSGSPRGQLPMPPARRLPPEREFPNAGYLTVDQFIDKYRSSSLQFAKLANSKANRNAFGLLIKRFFEQKRAYPARTLVDLLTTNIKKGYLLEHWSKTGSPVRAVYKAILTAISEKNIRDLDYNMVPGFYSQGGEVPGFGSSAVPAVLHGGEYVIRKSAVDKYGMSMLHNINQGVFDKAKRFQNGGFVNKTNARVPWSWTEGVTIPLSSVPNNPLTKQIADGFRQDFLRMIMDNPIFGLGGVDRSSKDVEKLFFSRYEPVKWRLNPLEPNIYQKFKDGKYKEYNGQIYHLKRGAPAATPGASWHTGGYAIDIVGSPEAKAHIGRVAPRYGIRKVTMPGEDWHFQPDAMPDGRRVIDFILKRYGYDITKNKLSKGTLAWINKFFASSSPIHPPEVLAWFDALMKKEKFENEIVPILPGAITKPRVSRFNGGLIPGFDSSAVPAILHGGEFVVSAKAVRNIGLDTLEKINNTRFAQPQATNTGSSATGESSVSNINIYVDNFIGEKAWFESMMNEYNVNVAPRNAKIGGTENRVISTYNGMNRRF